MTDKPGHLSRHRPESVPTTVPIAEAAARLGITVDAVRKRIQRGKLDGHKTDNGWVVVWTEADIRPDTVPTAVPDDRGVVDALRDSLARQQEEIQFLRRQSEESERRHAAEIERRDVLLREALGRIPQLPSGEIERTRAEPPTASPAGQGEEIAPKTTAVTLQSPPVVESVKWWQVWKR
jgi:hypothetical protein